MIDSHCHLADEAFAEDLEGTIGRARDAGLTGALCILSAGDAAESARAAKVRAMWPDVRFSVGIHPHHAGDFAGRLEHARTTVRQGVERERASALGEIGLDYHYDYSPRDVQQSVFRTQLRLALELDLPVIIHTREATDDTFALLREAGPAVRGVFHCFSGDVDMARAALDIGFYVSLAGIVTFPRADTLRDVAKLVPADRLLIETDAPYLAPVPYRGKRNEPAYVVRVAEVIAGVRGVAPEALSADVVGNFAAFLGRPRGATVSQETA